MPPSTAGRHSVSDDSVVPPVWSLGRQVALRTRARSVPLRHQGGRCALASTVALCSQLRRGTPQLQSSSATSMSLDQRRKEAPDKPQYGNHRERDQSSDCRPLNRPCVPPSAPRTDRRGQHDQDGQHGGKMVTRSHGLPLAGDQFGRRTLAQRRADTLLLALTCMGPSSPHLLDNVLSRNPSRQYLCPDLYLALRSSELVRPVELL